MRRAITAIVAGAILGGVSTRSLAQADVPSRVPLAFNHYYTYAELERALKAIGEAYPELVELRSIGKSLQGRDLWVAIVNSSKTGPHTSKPAMWIDGNVHGNEIQAAEAVLYSLWYLTKSYGRVEDLTTLLDSYSFYLLPSQNPDGREHWFTEAQNSSSSRSNQRPVDNDNDGLFDEDPPDDLDGDGSITQMWKADPNGRFVRDRDDPRIFRAVEPGKKGEWTPLGSEGIDNDGDGQINEDGPGGDDMNRNWPTDWLPNYVQFGAGPFPFSAPETRCIGRFILDRPNIAAGQSYHNAGGMILHGPGADYLTGFYPGPDEAVYEEIGRKGEDILPYYRYMVIYRDLYTVHGGFVNWLAEGLGIYSFTNEMWTDAKMFQRDVQPDEARRWLFRDRLLFGQTFKDYTEHDHPVYGPVLIGGGNKWDSRNTPTFMLEEELHRNFAFTMFHADQMPVLRFGRTDVARAGDLWTVTVEVWNDKLMPTRSAIARQRRFGTHDLLYCEAPAEARVALAGELDDWRDRQMNPIRHEPGRVQVEGGLPGRGMRLFRFYVEGPEGARVTLRYEAQKARTIEQSVELRATAP